MIALALFATAFAIRAVAGATFVGPAYPDSYYYAHVAQQLAAGRGFVTQYVWNLDDIGGALPSIGVLPAPANGYWMPLAEVVQVPFVWLLSPGPVAAALPFWIIGALAAPIAYLIGRDAGFSRQAATAAGLMVSAPAGFTPFMAQPDNFGLFMTLAALALWLCARGAAGDGRAFVAGGFVVGLATLARLDGALLGLPFALVGIRETLGALRGREVKLGWAPVAACVALFGMVLAPWLLRQLEVFGSVLPGGRTLWLTDYQQLFSFGSVPTPDAWLAQGLGPLLASRLDGLIGAIGLFSLLALAAVLVPLLVVGAWSNRTSPAFWPFFVYAAAMLVVMVGAFAVLVPNGTFMHAASALLPHTFLLVIAGTAVVVRWVADHRRNWSVSQATSTFSAAAVAITFIAAAIQTIFTTREWSSVRDVQVAIAARLQGAPVSERFMAVDPGAINYLTGRQGVVTPYDDLPVIERVLRAYDVRWLVLERGSIVPSLEPVLMGSVRPAWLSNPVAVVGEEAARSLAIAGSLDSAVAPTLPAAALYAVCLQATDTRCTP